MLLQSTGHRQEGTGQQAGIDGLCAACLASAPLNSFLCLQDLKVVVWLGQKSLAVTRFPPEFLSPEGRGATKSKVT